MRQLGAYVILIFGLIVAIFCMILPAVIDAHHWWPRKPGKHKPG